jgi:hypothetical protein
MVVTFSKELNTTEAEKINNYNLDMLGNPLMATPMFSGDAKKVLLTFNENFVDTFYNIRVSNLLSTANETIIPNSIALFIAQGTIEEDFEAPAKPTNLIATNGITEVLLEWDANTEADLSHYAIYRGAVQNFTPSQYTLLTTVTSNSFSDEEIFDYKVYYRVSAFDISGNESEYSDEASILVGVDDEKYLPTEFSLSQNYPNPFNPSTTIVYEIGETSFVTLRVYDILGNEVATLINKRQNQGIYSVQFNINSKSQSISSGIYFYSIRAGEYFKTMKMSFLK